MFLNGIWEPEVTKYICPKIAQGMTVIDVGADIGYYTLLFAKRVGRDGRVIAFEPIPSAREKLEHNVRLNGYTNVKICDFALFSSNGQAILEGPFQISRINPAKTTSEKKDIQIQTKIFDECVSKLKVQRIDLVKIDVEGAELDVLRGMEQSLEKYHPLLLIELHTKHLSHFNYGPEDLLRFLEVLNYRVHPVDKASLDFKNENTTIYCS
jgi:FkbM family methyltransferase